MISNGKKLYHRLQAALKTKKFYIALVLWGLIYGIFYANTLHETYPDEFDNILGGWYILHGNLPFSGFFSHHGPVAYFVASLITIFSGQSFVNFRIFYSIFLFLFTFGTFQFLQYRLDKKRVQFYLLLIILLGFASTYFWGHMLVADSLAAIFFLPAFALVTLKTIYKERLYTPDLIFISVLCALGVLTALTFIYWAFLIYVYALYYFFRHYDAKLLHWRSLKPFIILGLPYVVFLIYLLVTRSFSDYIAQSIMFNQKYYIYNYAKPDGASFINPIRYAISITHEFYNNFYTLLLQAKDFNFAFPFNVSMAVANVAFVTYLLLKGKYIFAALYVLLLIFSNARSNPLSSAEKDYQSAVYIVMSLFAMVFTLKSLYEELKHTVSIEKKVIFSFLLLFLGIHTFFNTSFLFGRFFDKTYTKYMGQAPLIYDRPMLTPLLHAATSEDSTILVGPLEFEELLYINRKNASKYHILLPGMGRAPQMQQELLSDLEKNKPEVIWFDKRFGILGQTPEQYAKFFLSYLEKDYITLQDYTGSNGKYVSNKLDERVDLETKLYIRKDRAEEVIARLLEKNFIKPTTTL